MSLRAGQYYTFLTQTFNYLSHLSVLSVRLRAMLRITVLFTLSLSFCHAATKWSVGLSTSSWTYSERIGVSYDGFLYGPQFEFSNDLLQNAHTEISLAYRFGSADYDGKLNTGAPFTYEAAFTNITSQALAFYHLPNISIEILAGISYYYLKDHDDKIEQDYEREQTYLTLPIGLRWSTKIKDHLFYADFIYHFWLYGENKSHWSDFNPSYSDLNLIQEKGYGLQSSVTWRYDQVSLVIDYIFWRVDDSETKNFIINGLIITDTFTEPQNKSNELKLAINWHF